MFQITGKIGGQVYKLKYRRIDDDEDYIVSGDDVAVEKLFAENKIDHGSLGLPPGTWGFELGYLNEETAARALVCNYVFDTITKSTDDWEPIPEGAIC